MMGAGGYKNEDGKKFTSFADNPFDSPLVEALGENFQKFS
jgi:hypothetical protein